MPPDLNIAGAIAVLIFLGVLICSVLLWSSHLDKGNKRSERPASVPTWSIGWANFGLFLCTLIISIFFTQIFAAKLISSVTGPIADEPVIKESGLFEEATDPDSSEIPEEAEPPALTPWLAVLSVLTLQIPMILTFCGLRKFYPECFGGRLNQKSVSIRKAISETTPYFIRYLPVIWLVSLAWVGLLTGLQKLGILDEFPPQQLVTILGNGQDPVAIVLLVVFAVVLAPLVEEIIFRGAIYRFFKGHTPVFTAQVISGAFFAAMHFNLMSFLPLLVIGVLFAQIYEKEGNILLPMFFHAYWNGFSLLMLFLMSQAEVPHG
ncbi:MAG: membrane protease YdiL (CAAX protease family) [Lentimonas sp.]|jgi:membrane protease YdiL (CAAX protease family)